MAVSPLLWARKPAEKDGETAQLHGVVVMSLPDHQDDGRKALTASAALRWGWVLHRAAEALMVLAAFGVARHCYRVYRLYSPVVAVRHRGRSGNGARGRFVRLAATVPLYPKKAGAGDWDSMAGAPGEFRKFRFSTVAFYMPGFL